MGSKPETTWKQLAGKAGNLAISATALAVRIVRKAGEGAGESVATTFIKDSDSEHEKNRKITLGKKTGSLASSLLTLGVIGSYLIDLTDALNDAEVEQETDTTSSPDISDEMTAPEKVIILPRDITDADVLTEAVKENNLNQAIPVDLDGDGHPDGFDTNGDGLIDTNLNGVTLGELESVSGYTTESGREVCGYTRTVADGTEANNIRV